MCGTAKCKRNKILLYRYIYHEQRCRQNMLYSFFQHRIKWPNETERKDLMISFFFWFFTMKNIGNFFHTNFRMSAIFFGWLIMGARIVRVSVVSDSFRMFYVNKIYEGEILDHIQRKLDIGYVCVCDENLM